MAGGGPVRPADPAHLAALADLHRACFPDDPWDAETLGRLAAMPGALLLCADRGFILLRGAADETEVITIAVDPAARGRGLGRALLGAGLDRAARAGAARAFLEVAVDNDAALALYRRAGFAEAGRRRGYYRRADGGFADALVMARDLPLS
ncbi:ribosomal protein S18-alanine N-acetyltransferase [Zavarzinia compransoris]|uniref:[Ribosomal protein bS18]-alanine N-acetyltransferase n=1 Tax=Zavarzinia compransoris TaxID=1264899 RepID=A0A317E367_9PROT|nr:ribosomal protein S18-alanine N-acetyltransferase [Zavarzinia compransoris]PWR20884.1 ribosomal-protein-alanine N-acetyltransferase [Zavarzinia compransoris]TDP44280.1 ribosomal-protein-alanine N-acetyltransferase [Zavarzinia compransoris]